MGNVSDLLNLKQEEQPKEQKKKKEAPPEDEKAGTMAKLLSENKIERRTSHYSILIKPSTLKAIKKAAKENGISANEAINIVLDEAFK